MPKAIRFIFDNWEDELLSIAHESIECAIASAYLGGEGVTFLSKVSRRLAEFAAAGNQIAIKVVLSGQFALTKVERLAILARLSSLPGMNVRIHSKGKFQHRKNYIFRTKTEIRVVVGSVNVTSSGLFRNLEIATLSVHEKNDPEAEKVISQFELLWQESEPLETYLEVEAMLKDEPRFSVGDNVMYTSDLPP